MYPDQLTVAEIIEVADVVQKYYKDTPLKFNVITLKVSSTDSTSQAANTLIILPGPHQV